jgi:FtsZ-interacting cell division protein YlmF
MAKKVYESENIAAVAAKMRELTGTDTQYTSYDLVDGAEEVYAAGYTAGYMAGSDGLYVDIKAHAAEIASIKTEQEIQNSNIEANASDIALIKAEQTTQDTVIEANTTEISAIKVEQATQNTAIKANADEISALKTGKQDNLVFNGTYNAESNKVATEFTVAEKVAELVASAPEDFDNLKEIADYIASDKTGATEINNKLSQHGTRISANEMAIADLEAKHDADIGNIGSALDELHTYAQNLVSGGEA